MNLRRVLILADESADWIVAGLQQLERLALSIDEFAVENKETGPVLVCVLWRPDLDQISRWIPKNEQLARIALTSRPDGLPYDLVLSTRLFLYRKTMPQLIEASVSIPKMISGEGEKDWANLFRQIETSLLSRGAAWEYLTDGSQIDEIETRFLRRSGKSQDGYVSRYLNRPISRGVTRLLLRFPTTPNGWTYLIFSIPIVATLVLLEGSYSSFFWGLVLFQLFSVLDGCDGEIARAKFMESEHGRELDDLFDVLSNVLLAVGLGGGLSRAHPRFSWLFLGEGISTATLILLNEWFLARAPAAESSSLGETLYPRHRALVERSGLLVFGKKFASLVIQLTKRDFAVLLFLSLAVVGLPAAILHLLFVVTAVTLGLALKSR